MEYTARSRSQPFLLIAVFSFAALIIALASQHLWNMQPCAWCVVQRAIYLVIGVTAALMCAFGSRRPRIGASLTAVLSLLGIWAAWHQNAVAAKSLSCDQTFADRVVSNFGLDAALPSVFGIFATCFDASVEILGLEYAIWSLALFILLLLLSLRTAFRAKPN